jgi:hypothetical protein
MASVNLGRFMMSLALSPSPFGRGRGEGTLSVSQLPSPYPSPAGGFAQKFEIERKIAKFRVLILQEISRKTEFLGKALAGRRNAMPTPTVLPGDPRPARRSP